MKSHLIDVSHWNGNIDWSVAQAAAPAIIKSTEGVSFVDSEFTDNKSGLQHYGKTWGNYHFFLPGYDPISQAKHNIATVGSGCLVYTVDVETPLIERLKTKRLIQATERLSGKTEWDDKTTIQAQELIDADLNLVLTRKPGSVLEHATLATMVGMYIDWLLDKVPHVRVLFYSSPYFWKTYMKLPDGSYPNWNAVARLWEAHYYVDDPMPMPPWDTCLIHQYADNLIIPGIPGETDGNWFYGDESQRDSFFGNGGSVPAPPPLPEKVYINVSTLNIRNAPTDIDGILSVIGTTTYNKVWYPEDAVLDERGRKWWKVGKKVYLASWLTRE